MSITHCDIPWILIPAKNFLTPSRPIASISLLVLSTKALKYSGLLITLLILLVSITFPSSSLGLLFLYLSAISLSTSILLALVSRRAFNVSLFLKSERNFSTSFRLSIVSVILSVPRISLTYLTT